MEHAVFDIGNSGIEIRWGMDIDDFDDPGNLYDIISLVAANYEQLYNQKKYISISFYKNGGKYLLRYSINNKQDFELHTEKFSDTIKIIKGILIENFKLKDSAPESTNLLLMAIPMPDGKKDPEYGKFLEFYVGAAPGQMQMVENKKLYYLYYFFKEGNIFKIINREPSFKAIIMKKKINRNNIEKFLY